MLGSSDINHTRRKTLLFVLFLLQYFSTSRNQVQINSSSEPGGCSADFYFLGSQWVGMAVTVFLPQKNIHYYVNRWVGLLDCLPFFTGGTTPNCIPLYEIISLMYVSRWLQSDTFIYYTDIKSSLLPFYFNAIWSFRSANSIPCQIEFLCPINKFELGWLS